MHSFIGSGTRLLAVGFAVSVIVACGGAGGAPGTGGPGGPPNAGVISGVSFDLTDAVLLHVGSTSEVTGAGGGGALIKVTDTGEALPALVEGNVEVADFFVRNGRVYVLLTTESAAAVGCVLGEIDAEGDLRCVDPDLESIDVRSLQFDALGGIYYRGVANGRDVIRRARDGTANDFHVAPGWIEIEQFAVTRAGAVIVSQVSGQVARQYTVELLADPAAGIVGRVLASASFSLPIYDFLPDGSLLASRPLGGQAYPWRLLVDGEPEWDVRRFVDVEPRVGAASPRFVFDVGVFSDVRGRIYRADATMVGVTGAGLVRIDPDVRMLPLPIETVTAAAVGGGFAAVGGSSGLHKTALWVDLATGAHRDLLGGREIEVLAVRLDHAAQRVVMFGRDVTVNAAVLATFDLALGELDVIPADAPLDRALDVVDLTVGHVPPPVQAWQPEPIFDASVIASLHDSAIAFDATATSRAGYLDQVTWWFGDGEVLNLEVGYATGANGLLDPSRRVGLQIVHAYGAPASAPVRLEVVTDRGRRGVVDGTAEIPFVRVVQVVAEAYNSYVVREDGAVWSWGQGYFGQLGHGDYEHRNGPTHVDGIEDVVALVAGREHVVALVEDGALWTWGANAQGQVGDGTRDARLVPLRLTGLQGVSAVAAGGHHTLALVGGEVWGWGHNFYGAAGSPSVGDVLTPRKVAGLPSDIVAIAAGGSASFAQTASGDLWVWGYNYYGNLGVEAGHVGAVPVRIEVHPGFLLEAGRFAPNSNHVVASTAAGVAYAFGWNGFGQLGVPAEVEQTWSPVGVTGLDDVPVGWVAAGHLRSGAVAGAGTVWVWGSNDRAQIGDGSYANRFAPVEVATPAAAVAIALGDDHGLLLLTDGGVAAWGVNDFGQVGDGTRNPVGTPIRLR